MILIIRKLAMCVLISSLGLAQAGGPPSPPKPGFRGSDALADAGKAVEFGERPSGSLEIGRLRNWIVSRMKPLDAQVTLDSFTGHTPLGPVPMVNIIVKFAGNSGKAVAVTGHYDTKRIAMTKFVGANDGGSSTGFLLEFARTIAALKHRDDIYVIFFDGEEAVVQWTEADSRYGSRHLAAKWAIEGLLSKVKALINVDMIGDRDLGILNDASSSRSLRTAAWAIADKLGYGKFFNRDEGGIDDDHKPFLDSGVNAMDLIDFEYGPDNAYWHTEKDTMDKLGAHSFQVVGDVVLGTLKELEKE